VHLTLVSHNIISGDGQGRANYEIVKHALKSEARVTMMADRVAPDLVQAGARWIPIRPGLEKPNLLKVWRSAQLADGAIKRETQRGDLLHGCGYTLTSPHSVNTSQFVHRAWLASPVHTSRIYRNGYGFYQWLYSFMNARFEQRSYAAARHVVAVSRRVKSELEAIGVDPARICVIHNGVDPREFYPGHEDRAELGLPAAVPLLLFVGDIRTPRKNLDTVLKALSLTPGAHLAVVGNTAKSPYPAAAGDLGIADRVHFLGYRSDVPRLMRSADIFVCPSRYEACTLVLVEAMASGLPVITAETTGGSEVLEPDCGIRVADPNDAAALAEAQQSLLDDAAGRKAMGDAAREVAMKYTWDRIAEAYMSLYREVA
jgi:glycosyltransferase involved in cell wall biosynthesis